MNVILTSFKTSNSLVVRWVRWENYHQPNLSSNLVSFIGSHSFFFLSNKHLSNLYYMLDFPGGTSDKEPNCQCKRHRRLRFDPWVGKVPWRKVWQEKPGGLQSLGSQRVGHD